MFLPHVFLSAVSVEYPVVGNAIAKTSAIVVIIFLFFFIFFLLLNFVNTICLMYLYNANTVPKYLKRGIVKNPSFLNTCEFVCIAR